MCYIMDSREQKHRITLVANTVIVRCHFSNGLCNFITGLSQKVRQLCCVPELISKDSFHYGMPGEMS